MAVGIDAAAGVGAVVGGMTVLVAVAVVSVGALVVAEVAVVGGTAACDAGTPGFVGVCETRAPRFVVGGGLRLPPVVVDVAAFLLEEEVPASCEALRRLLAVVAGFLTPPAGFATVAVDFRGCLVLCAVLE